MEYDIVARPGRTRPECAALAAALRDRCAKTTDTLIGFMAWEAGTELAFRRGDDGPVRTMSVRGNQSGEFVEVTSFVLGEEFGCDMVLTDRQT